MGKIVSGLASLTLLYLTSSTLLHFGKTSKLSFRSAFATSGIESELSLLSICAMLASLTLLWLISSTLLHFGKTSKFVFRSAFATSGIVSKLPLLSLCATFNGLRPFDSLYYIYLLVLAALAHQARQPKHGTGFK